VKQPTGAHVLVVDDEPALLRTVSANLGRRGFRVALARTGESAIAQAEDHPDLIVLDLGLPDTDGLDVIRRVRARSDTPIIVLSARDSEREKVQALELGADDYLTKPFGVDELVARVRVALRHSARIGGSEPVFRTGALTVDLERRRVTVDGEEVRLSCCDRCGDRSTATRTITSTCTWRACGRRSSAIRKSRAT